MSFRGFIVNLGYLMSHRPDSEGNVVDNLLLEDGFNLLLEDGGLIVLE